MDSCYTDVKEKVDSWIKLRRTIVSLTTDGWSNVLQDGIVNYMLTNSSRCVFYEAAETKKQRHNKEWLALDISQVISSVDCFVAGVVTDNTAANKAAWEILLKKYPNRFFYGCASHGLHLLVKNIFEKPPIELKDVYPFTSLANLITDVTTICKYFRNHIVEKATLEEFQEALKLQKLKLYGETRWGSILASFRTMLQFDEFRVVANRHRCTKGSQTKD